MQKLLFVIIDFASIDKSIKEELSLYYDVSTLYNADNVKFKYKNIGQRLYNFYRKKFFNDKSYKSKLIAAYKNQLIIDKIKQSTTFFDYTLVFNVDYFDNYLLELLKTKTKKMYAYQWDGFDRSPDIYNKIKIFDKFYSFNPADVNNTNVFGATNFYLGTAQNPRVTEPTLYYIACYNDNRTVLLQKLYQTLKNTTIALDFILLYHDTDLDKLEQLKKQYAYINFITKSYSYTEVLTKTEQCNVILDIKLTVHNGLSLRFFESLKYSKKIITNNKAIVNYDFYHPNNIFILDNNYHKIESFLALPYYNLPLEIVNKYSFKNWINYILEKQNAISINLPIKEIKND